MSILSSSAMASAVALLLFCVVFFVGGVNPELAGPGMIVLLVAVIMQAVRLATRESRGKALSIGILDVTVAAFVVYAAARYATSQVEYEARNELIQIFASGLSFFIASKGVRDRDGRRLFVYALSFFALFQAGLGIWQALSKTDYIFVWERPELYNGRGSGTFICPNHLAGFLEMSLGLLVARIAIARKEGQSTEKSVLLKVVLIYIAVMIGFGILTSLSRAGWAATCAGMVVLLFMGGWSRSQALARFGIIFALFICVAWALWSFEPIRNYLVKSVQTGVEDKTIALGDPTMGGRTMMWSGTIELIRQQPLWGTGIGSWQWAYQKVKDYRLLSFPEYTHNDYLNLASDYGLVGVFLIALVFVFFFRHAIRVLRSSQSSEDRAFAAGAVAAVTSILVHSWFDFNLHIPGNSVFLAIIMGLTAGISVPTSKTAELRPWGRRVAALAAVLIAAFMSCLYIPTLRAFLITGRGDSAKYDLAYDQALADYGKATKIDPRYAKPLIRTGDIYRDQLAWRVGPGKARERRELSDKAVAAYDQALALNGYLSEVWLSRGRVLEQVGRHDEALASYLKAIDVAPVSAFAHFVTGQYYRERGQPEKAVEYFENAGRYFLWNDPMFQLSQWYEQEKLKAPPKGE